MSREYPVLDITEVFRRAAEEKNRRRPFIVADRELTYGTVVDRTRRLTRYYHDAGLVAGDRVIIASHDDLEASVLFLSLLRNGITAVLVDPETKPHRFAHIMRAAQPKGVILDAALRGQWQPAADVVLDIRKDDAAPGTLLEKLLGKKKAPGERGDTYPAFLSGIEGMDGPDAVDRELDAYILFTSGTTSDPKGVRISHRALFSHLRTLSSQFGYGPDSRILNILLLSHVDGIVQGPMAAFVNSAALYRPMRFEVRLLPRLLDAVYTFRITHFVTVPTVLSLIDRLCRDHPDAFRMKDFRFIVSTGAYLDAKLWQAFEERFGVRVANVYGLTESVTGGLFSGPTDRDHMIGTVGRPADCEVRLAGDDGAPARLGGPGELLMKGDHLMTGYVNAPEATAAVLRDGWLHTGDIATVDGNGFYRIVGRKKNLIITGGINVHPEEVTEVLKLSPSVLDAVTFGLPDETWGEQVISAVALDPEKPLSEQELISFCRGHLEETKLPHRIHVLPSLPKGPVGKVIIEQVKQMVGAAGTGGARGGGRDPETELITLAASCFKVPAADLSLATGPDDTTGWDSLAHLELVSAIEGRFGVQFTPAEIMRVGRLEDAWNIVSEKLAQR